MNKLLVIYRNNDLFDLYMPQILALVPPAVNVTTLIFPQGTTINEMVEPMRKILNAVTEPCFFLSDKTCSLYGGNFEVKLGDAFEKARATGMKTLSDIDWSMEQETKEMFKETSFTGLLNIISPLLAPSPKTIGIVTKNLTDHLYGFKDTDDFKDYYSDREGFADKLKEYFNALYPSAEVVVFLETDEAVESLGDKEGALIVADRHTGILKDSWGLDGWKHTAQLLMLPFENATMHLVKKGLWKEPKSPERLFEVIMGKNKFE